MSRRRHYGLAWAMKTHRLNPAPRPNIPRLGRRCYVRHIVPHIRAAQAAVEAIRWDEVPPEVLAMLLQRYLPSPDPQPAIRIGRRTNELGPSLSDPHPLRSPFT